MFTSYHDLHYTHVLVCYTPSTAVHLHWMLCTMNVLVFVWLDSGWATVMVSGIVFVEHGNVLV